MSDVEQLGVREELDKIEFEKFQTDFIKIYTTRLNTIDSSTQFLTADLIRRDIKEFTSENESVEMGLTKFTIIDDREGHIPLITNSQVESYIRYFQGKGRKGFNVWLKRYVQYKDIILPILDEYDLPEELIVVSMIEAGLDPKAVSRAQAVGLWQFMYSTGKEYGLNRNWYIDERQDPIKSTRAASKYFKDLYKEFDDWYLVLAAYNGGWGRLNRALKLHETSDYWQLYSLPQETKNYIPYYLSAAIIVKNPEKYGFRMPKSNPLKYDVVQIEKSADLTVIAKAAGTKLSTIKRLNPELRQPATPNNGPYSLNIPYGKKDIFNRKFKEIPEDRKFAFQKVEHRVQKGENLISIASKYRVLVADLQTINNISNINKLSIGQMLKIPVKGGLYSNYPEKIIYSVKSGDTLGHIAEEFNTRASEIRKWNNMGSKSVIYPGQKLSLFVKRQPVKDSPKKNVYIVKSGDNLGKIANKNNTSVAKIKIWNNMKSSTIYPGQKLTIYFE
jgi:membrane-bound lytic murein transglycosylase D